MLCSYILVLDLSVLAVALFKRWRLLDVIAFLGTLILFANWGAAYYTPDALTPTMLWLMRWRTRPVVALLTKMMSLAMNIISVCPSDR